MALIDNEKNIVAHNLEPGMIVAGRYEIDRFIGRGQVGIVYTCRNNQLPDRLLAMKILSPSVYLANPEKLLARFEREIISLYQINHPNVVRNYDFVRDQEIIAYTMEYVGGGNLAQYMGSHGVIPVREVIRLLKQMCAGVQAIHEASIIHRDLKPENILLTKSGKVKIADFGIARQLGVAENDPGNLTSHGSIIGTFEYLSPEYLTKNILDARIDIYALGILAYKLLLRKTPFKGDSVLESIKLKLESVPFAPHQIRDDCPEELSAVILRALKADPNKRFQTAAEMRDALTTISLNNKIEVVLAEDNTPKNLTAFSDRDLREERVISRPGEMGGSGVALREWQRGDSGSMRRIVAPNEVIKSSRHLASATLSGSDLSTNGLKRGYEWVSENTLENTSEWILKIGIVLLVTLVSLTIIFFSFKYFFASRESIIQPSRSVFSEW